MPARRPACARFAGLRARCAAAAALLFIAGHAVNAADNADRDAARYAGLVRVVDHNVGHAHGTRGMNACTILALRDASSKNDIGVLRHMLEDRDRIVALTAVYVLPTLGDAGVAALKAGMNSRNRGDAEAAIQSAANTVETINRYRASGECKLRK
jgi:hypothetical protein